MLIANRQKAWILETVQNNRRMWRCFTNGPLIIYIFNFLEFAGFSCFG